LYLVFVIFQILPRLTWYKFTLLTGQSLDTVYWKTFSHLGFNYVL